VRRTNPIIKTTPEQRAALDAAVFTVITHGTLRGHGATNSEIVEWPAIQAMDLPDGKPKYRYVDGALQRLRRAKRIRVQGARWLLTPTTRRP